jgi:hypothetical protein
VSGFGNVRGRPIRHDETIQTVVPVFCGSFGILFWQRVYARWVLTWDHGFGIFDRFGGGAPKEMVDVENTTFLTKFPELKAAPRTRKEMFEMSLAQGRACFEEWSEIDLSQTSEIACPLGKKQRMWMISPDSMVLDLVDRGHVEG